MSRLLTNGEIVIAKKMFKDSIKYDRVKIHDSKYVLFQPDNSGMTPNGEIYIHGIYSQDYSKEPGALRGFFIHEMVHIWQNQNNIFNVVLASIWEMLTEGFNYNNAYKYNLDVTKDLLSYDVEQHAAIIEDYYRISIEKMLPRRARIQNKETGLNLIKLYQAVLKKFLNDPKYVKHK